ncbi:hypothetical protein BO70DRAFT_365233 [Aspergillus heteromorphus CBS 117.55]|uniref:Uncharacterized protein n=1 Tax=Aspergillus heteromorphus CBS 117.55 TaxID=1448321 RepID=A0A317VGE2_9EURO|nr:uncharacterized protein BO70DRAFT_365233 [Aspergillus heteromorphus CBS 117.55]PWY70920.1 hypothetical protein BO70DRAFT_365233 [Aspergillus heteromorphus CBS 117.55]
MNPIPIIVCGKSPKVATGVINRIRPVYEAIHIIQSVEAGVRDIPSLIEGRPPPYKDTANLGTQKYGKRAAAVVVGGGYDDANFAQLRSACEGKSKIPWLRHDISKDFDPRQPRREIGVEYGEQTGKKVVDCLQDLARRGKMKEDGVYWF